MEHLETIKRIVSTNVGKSKDELIELVVAELPSIDREQCEKILNDILVKAVDVVVAAADAVLADIAVDEKKKAPMKKILSFLKSLFLSCIHTTAVRVSRPQAPPVMPVVPEAEPSVDNEPPPLEPSPEKV